MASETVRQMMTQEALRNGWDNRFELSMRRKACTGFYSFLRSCLVRVMRKMIKIKGRAKFLYRQKNGEVFDRVEN